MVTKKSRCGSLCCLPLPTRRPIHSCPSSAVGDVGWFWIRLLQFCLCRHVEITNLWPSTITTSQTPPARCKPVEASKEKLHTFLHHPSYFFPPSHFPPSDLTLSSPKLHGIFPSSKMEFQPLCANLSAEKASCKKVGKFCCKNCQLVTVGVPSRRMWVLILLLTSRSSSTVVQTAKSLTGPSTKSTASLFWERAPGSLVGS